LEGNELPLKQEKNKKMVRSDFSEYNKNMDDGQKTLGK
jgi:hypothetical protein